MFDQHELAGSFYHILCVRDGAVLQMMTILQLSRMLSDLPMGTAAPSAKHPRVESHHQAMGLWTAYPKRLASKIETMYTAMLDAVQRTREQVAQHAVICGLCVDVVNNCFTRSRHALGTLLIAACLSNDVVFYKTKNIAQQHRYAIKERSSLQAPKSMSSLQQ